MYGRIAQPNAGVQAFITMPSVQEKRPLSSKRQKTMQTMAVNIITSAPPH